MRSRNSSKSSSSRLCTAAALLALACMTTAGCAANAPVLQPAPAPAASMPASTASVAGQISVESPKGALNQNQKEQVLHDVAAQGGAEAMKRQLAAMAGFGEVGLSTGNDAKLLIDGPATFKAMFDAIGKARYSILLESYIIEDTALSQQLAALLAEKRKQGVQVMVLYDSLGSLGTSDAFFTALQDKGIATCAFNSMNPLKPEGKLDLTHRDHRKILTVDREIGFTGGINISAVYSSGSFGPRRKSKSTGSDSTERGWRDTQVQLRGPAVGALDDLIIESWQQQKCEGTPPVPKPGAGRSTAGQQLLRIVSSTPDDQTNHIYALMMSSIGAAQHSIYLTMAYFAPGPELIDALRDAAGRGVDVKLVLPSRSDFSPVLHAGRSHYDRLLEGGVKIYELQDAVLHAKTFVIDGVVSTVGSSNMDSRSFTGNNEVDAVVIGEDFGDAMKAMFRKDLEASKPITLEDWKSRSAWQRTKEFFARMFEGIW